MRRLQHLPGVLRVEVRIVVVHALGDFEQHLAHRGRVYMRSFESRERGKSLLHPLERLPEERERVFVELVRLGSAHLSRIRDPQLSRRPSAQA